MFVALVAFTELSLSQESTTKRKPILIRPDPVEEQLKKRPIVPDAEKAKQHVEIGDFYYQRDNYKAAAKRYREAILYGPKWAEGYKKLIRVLEKQQAFLKAIEVCEEFILRNGLSDQADHFERRAKKLQEERERVGGPEG